MSTLLFQQPLQLDHAGAWRVYLGGSQIRALRGQLNTPDDHYPEEWIASTTEAKGAGAVPGAGLSQLLQRPGLTLDAVIRSDPSSFLGRGFVSKYGAHPGVLLKLLDAAERLNVQIHPDRPTAKRFFHSDFGKAECWHFLQGRMIDGQEPRVYLGLKEHVTKELWRSAFDRGNPEEILNCMHSFPATPGQTVFVEGGVPHAIGAGCFLLELQEPADFTLRMERRTRSGTVLDDETCHMGMGYDAMFDSIRYDHMTEEQTRDTWFVTPEVLLDCPHVHITRLLGYDRCPYFAFDRMEISQSFSPEVSSVFCGLFVLKGAGSLEWDGGHSDLTPGAQFFLPANTAVNFQPQDDMPLTLIRFFGPAV